MEIIDCHVAGMRIVKRDGLENLEFSGEFLPRVRREPPERRPVEMALSGVHAAAHRVLSGLPGGKLYDLGAGQGALSLWADEHGFEVTGVDINRNNYVVPLDFLRADLNGPLPIPDAVTDVTVALEVVEHLENVYSFFREMARITRPGGHVVFSTPNETNLCARLSYFTSGFFSDAAYVMRVREKNEHYYPHVNCLPLPTLEFAWRSAGLELESFEVSRTRILAAALYPVLAPLQAWRLVMRHHKPRHAARTDEHAVYRLMLNPRVLTGRILVFCLRRPFCDVAELRSAA